MRRALRVSRSPRAERKLHSWVSPHHWREKSETFSTSAEKSRGAFEGLVRADGVGGEIGIFEVHDREGVGVGGIVGGVFRALLHDSDAHRVGRRKDLVAVAQYQARVEGQGAEQEGEKEGETGAHARRVDGRVGRVCGRNGGT